MTELYSYFGSGLGLAAAAGLNSYAVLLVYGGLARLFPEDFPGGIAAMLSTTTALLAVSGLFVLEFFVDKIPGLDHFWDLLHAFVRPMVGCVLAVAAVGPQVPQLSLAIFAGAAGALVALVSHLVKTVTRATSTALTAGIANLALSLAEDVLAFLQALLALFLPLVSLAVVAGLGVLFIFSVPRLARSINYFDRRRTRREPTRRNSMRGAPTPPPAPPARSSHK